MTDILKQSLVEHGAGMMPSLPQSSAESRWGFFNGWSVAPQSDDRAPVRPPVHAAATPENASPSARRSSARRKHQAMFKQWSQARHD
ncbi:MAG: hypothetical protein ABJA18_01075 [bacterium]